MIAQPIREEDLDAVGLFLHKHLSQRIAAKVWSESLRHRWAENQPNFGMQLITDDGQRVGVLCAVYSDQLIDGKRKRRKLGLFSNVLEKIIFGLEVDPMRE